jgi:hypothetical protein
MYIQNMFLFCLSYLAQLWGLNFGDLEHSLYEGGIICVIYLFGGYNASKAPFES